MKIALVSPYSNSPHPPLGMGYLASYLEKHTGFTDIRVIDANVHDIKKEIGKMSPDMIGFSSTSNDYGRCIETAKWIKEILDVPVFIGGVHISTLPTSLKDCFDFGLIGEGEQTFLELFRLFESRSEFPKSELKKISGLVFKEDGRVVFTKPRELIQNIDEIPFPKRELFDMDFYLKPKPVFMHVRGIGTNMLTSRGCPYNCVFCSTKKLWKVVRMHSAEYVISEMEHILKKYPKVKIISVYDDLFIVNRDRVRRVSEFVVERGINKKVMFNVVGRTNLIDDGICMDLRAMNVRNISFGMESGSQRILSYLKKDTLTVEQNLRAIEICRRHGIRTDGSFIFGSPNETIDDMKKTIDFIYRSNLDSVNVFVLTPFPGTEIWDIAKENGIVSEDMNWEKIDMGCLENSLAKEVPKEEFKKIYEEAVKAARSCSISKYKINAEFIKSGISTLATAPGKTLTFPFRMISAKIKMRMKKRKDGRMP